MNWNDSQPDDPLDDLLRKAAWPEPSPEHVERLQSRWQQSVRRRKIRTAAIWSSLAVLLVASLMVPYAMLHERQIAEVVPPEKPVENRPIVAEKNQIGPAALVQDTPAPRRQTAAALPPVRDPTPQELAVSTLHRRRMKLEKKPTVQHPVQPTVARKISPHEAVLAAVERVATDPEANVPAIAQELAAAHRNCELLLQRAFRDRWLEASNQKPSAEQLAELRATLRLLSQVASNESLPLLWAAAGDADCPSETLDAIARLSTVEQLGALAVREKSPDRQRLWLAAMLDRGTPLSVTAFLRLAGEPATAEGAMEAIAHVKQPPVDELIRALSNSRMSIRLTAARALGSLNDPAVSQRLVQMAMNQVQQREALLALLSSSDPVARQFVAVAQNDVILAASLRALRPRANDL